MLRATTLLLIGTLTFSVCAKDGVKDVRCTEIIQKTADAPRSSSLTTSEKVGIGVILTIVAVAVTAVIITLAAGGTFNAPDMGG